MPIVYLAEHPALAMLEVLVHFELTEDEVPEKYQLLEVQCEAASSQQSLQQSALKAGWQDNTELTRSIGDEWLSSGSSLLLKVPSAITPFSYNFLFNPRHPDAAGAQVISATKHPYDERLLDAE